MDMNKLTVYVGTVRGFLLSTTDKPNHINSANPGTGSQVTALVFGRNPSEIVIGYDNSNVTIYDSKENKKVQDLTWLKGKGPVVGLECIDDYLMVVKSDGVVNKWNDRKNVTFEISFDEKGSLDTAVHNKSRENIIGTGGEHNDFKLWDLNTQQCIFKAKSLGHDYLDLPIPTSVRGISFFNESPHLSACCTKEGHVLLYDDRVQRRPVVKFLEKKASYTCISSTHRERQCLVGTTRGYMQLLDMKAGKCVKTFTSFTGSVTSIACDPVEPYVATTSLDRYLRIHNLDNKELIHKVYMKQSLTKLLMKPIVKEEPTDIPEKVDEEFEEIFEQMEVVTEGKTKKRKTSQKLDEDDEIISVQQKKVHKSRSKENKEERTEVAKKKTKKKKIGGVDS
ncbi:WD repeat domain 74 lethal (2) k09848 [Leptinotarsa decemlineata]|uniref:WD repeat domain 74 lethal (2) k09848 n=1 Tax=Leptinotarsa decemlineata TaxID=7539 RepID=UPI003D304C46